MEEILIAPGRAIEIANGANLAPMRGEMGDLGREQRIRQPQAPGKRG